MSFKPNNQPIFNNAPKQIAIIGGGVAGMSCALWLNQLGLSPIIIERNSALGGQLLNYNRVNNWVLGFQHKTSVELASLYHSHIVAENIPISYCTELTAIESIERGYRLFLQTTDLKSVMEIEALVIATGVRALIPENFSHIEGFNLLYAAKLIYGFPTDHLDKLDFLRGKRVAVIGGGDNAHFTTADIALSAACTFLLTRSPAKAQNKIRQKVQALITEGRVIEYQETTIHCFRQHQEGIEISLLTSNLETLKITVDLVFIRTGFTPNTEFISTFPPLAQIEQQPRGYLHTDSCQRTSIASVYAIGDVASPTMQSVVTAIAQGAIAAHSIAKDSDAKG